MTGGTGPYKCTLQSGAVPAGLTLNSNCSLTGDAYRRHRKPDHRGVRLGQSAGKWQRTGHHHDQPGSAYDHHRHAAERNRRRGLQRDDSESRVAMRLIAARLVTGTLQAGLSLGANCVVSGDADCLRHGEPGGEG